MYFIFRALFNESAFLITFFQFKYLRSQGLEATRFKRIEFLENFELLLRICFVQASSASAVSSLFISSASSLQLTQQCHSAVWVDKKQILGNYQENCQNLSKTYLASNRKKSKAIEKTKHFNNALFTTLFLRKNDKLMEFSMFWFAQFFTTSNYAFSNIKRTSRGSK